MKRNRLKKMSLNFVSFVGRGAHGDAEVVLAKSDDAEPAEGEELFKMNPTASESSAGGKSKKKAPKSEDDEPDAEDLGLDEDGESDEEEKPKKVKKNDGVTTPGDSPSTLINDTEVTHMTDIDLTSFSPEELIAYVEKMEEKVISKDEEISTLRKAADADDSADTTADDSVEGVLAKVDDPALASFIQKMADKADAAETIAKAERDARLDAEMIVKAEALDALGVPVEELAPLLKTLHETDEELFGSIVKVLDQSAAVVETADIFSEIGKTGNGIDSDLEAQATALRKEDPSLTKSQAIAKALEADPTLYDQSHGG